MKNRNSIIITCLFLSIVFLTTGTFAYFRRGATGNVNVNTGKLTLSINDKSAYKSETFEVVLTNADGSNLKPGDSGSFNLELDASGSSFDVSINLELSRTNLPDNLKFYLDSEHTKLFTKRKYNMEKSSSMVENVTIYWYWEDLEESNDNDFMFTEISAEITGTVSYFEDVFLYNSLISSNYTLDTNVNFGAAPSATNGQGLMMRDGTQNDTYPIFYYRGDVSDNVVIFADFCWLIVRTTETGGIKLVYNGEVNTDGSCNNYSGVGGQDANSNYDDVYIGRDYMHINYWSPTYVGYMNSGEAYYDLYNNGPHDIVEGYYNEWIDNSLDKATGRHVQNLEDSFAKEKVDAWYKGNILGTSYEQLVEDTIWCNDRSIINTTYNIQNFDSEYLINFSAKDRLLDGPTVVPSLSCAREVDRFTVNRANGNGDLTYPIALITADEAVLAGFTNIGGSINYLLNFYCSSHFWTLTPCSYSNIYAFSFTIKNASKSFAEHSHQNNSAIRPAISLGANARIMSGNGSFEEPYVIG